MLYYYVEAWQNYTTLLRYAQDQMVRWTVDVRAVMYRPIDRLAQTPLDHDFY